ncbi:MAG: TonB-dependent receptor [Bacteroidota bacterium]|nr:TonB-dependent receptor [Bacteroidota bacterium]
MKKIFSFLLLFSLAFPLWAAVSIKGSIVDAGDQTPLDFVNVTLFKQGSKKPITLVSTDTNGSFVIPTVENGKYNLRISYVGYNTVNKVIEVNSSHVNLGVIKMDADSKKLGEVEVVGQSAQMHFDVDKKVFNVDQNIAAAGGSATDVLKNIPSVTVDDQGNVALRKDGNVEVWINGKASGLTADNRAQVLQQLPAESIESIEVMTNPSAKYNPEGSAGIINIVMKKNHKAGYYGSVSAGLTSPDNGKLGKNLGASINYSSNKVDAYVNLGYRAMSFQGGGTTNRRNFVGKDTTLLNQTNTMGTSFSGLFMRAGVDYHLDSKNTLSLSGFGMAGDGNQNTFIHNRQTDLATDPANLLRNYTQDNTGSGNRPSLNMNLDYHHDFDKKGSGINANVSYSAHKRDGNGTYDQNDLITKAESNINQNTTSNNTEFEAKVDYTNKLSETSKLEAGWQSDVSNRLSSTSGTNNPTASNGLLIPTDISTYYDNFNYNEQIHAGYLTYGNRFDKLNFQLGMRAEYFRKGSTNTYKVGNTERDTVQVIPQKGLFHIFPSFYLSYSLSANDELQFNYSNRVNRPRGQQINPFKNYSDSTNITYGNPNLAPQYSSSLELNYIKTLGAQTLSASVYYHSTDNVIQNVRFLHDGVMQSTYLNIANSQNTGLELISKNRVFRILNLTSTLNLYYSKLDSATFVSPYDQRVFVPGQSNFSWSANVMANFMLSKTFSGQITGNYSSPQLIAQGTQNAKYTVDLGVRQTFMNRNLSLSLNVRDLFNSDRGNQTTSGSGFTQTTTSYFHGRMYGLTLSYNFGNMKPKQTEKKKEASPDMNMDNAD